MSNPWLSKSKYTACPSVVVANDSKLPDRIPMQLVPLTTLRAKRRNLKETVMLPFGRASAGEKKDLCVTPNRAAPARFFRKIGAARYCKVLQATVFASLLARSYVPHRTKEAVHASMMQAPPVCKNPCQPGGSRNVEKLGAKRFPDRGSA
jgi:hypothetical protein